MSASDTRLPVRRSGNERTFDDTEEEDEASAIRIQIKRENMFSETTKHKVQEEEEEEDEEGGGRREGGGGSGSQGDDDEPARPCCAHTTWLRRSTPNNS
jgi:hypothetical protein